MSEILERVAQDTSLQQALVALYRHVIRSNREQALLCEAYIQQFPLKIALSGTLLSGNQWKDERQWIALYDSALDKEQEPYRQLLYPKLSDQYLRHQQIVGLIDSPASLLDVGCGFGDLLTALRIAGKHPDTYVGIDGVSRFIAVARQRFASDTNTLFVECLLENFQPKDHNLPTHFDYVVACGIQIGQDLAEVYVTLQKLSSLGRHVIFNFLAAEHYNGIYLSYWTRDLADLVSHVAPRFEIHMIPEVSDVTIKMSNV